MLSLIVLLVVNLDLIDCVLVQLKVLDPHVHQNLENSIQNKHKDSDQSGDHSNLWYVWNLFVVLHLSYQKYGNRHRDVVVEQEVFAFFVCLGIDGTESSVSFLAHHLIQLVTNVLQVKDVIRSLAKKEYEINNVLVWFVAEDGSSYLPVSQILVH